MSPGCRLGYLSWAASNPGSTAHGPRAHGPPPSYRTVLYVEVAKEMEDCGFSPRCCAEPKQAWVLYFACAIIMQNKASIECLMGYGPDRSLVFFPGLTIPRLVDLD